MKWLIAEDALRDRKGHWVEYVSTFVRELRALGDEVVVLCDQRAQVFVMEQMGASPVLPESIWHRMGDGAGALKRYLRVPRHAVATFFAIRKFFNEFNHRGRREHRVGVDTQGEAQGNAQRTCAGAAFSNPSTSELARDSENTSLIRSAGSTSYLPQTIYSLPATSSPPDWIFVPTVLVHHLLGWWMLLKTGSVPKEARVLLFFPNLPIRLDDKGKPHWSGGPTTKLMAWLFENLRGEVECGKVVMGVETHAMRRALEGLIRMPVVYLPHPVPAKSGRDETRVERRESGVQSRKDVLTTIEHRGRCKMEQSQIGPKGEGVGTTESKDSEGTEDGEAGLSLAGHAGAAFSNPFTSKLARDSENTSLIRTADGPASLPSAIYSPPAASAKPIVFGCYGAARWEKGSDIFQEAIKLILKNEVASAETTSLWGCAGEPANGSTKGESRGRDRGNRVSSARNQSAAGLSEPVTNYSLPATAAGRPLHFCIQWVEDFQDDSGNLVSIDTCLSEHPQVELIGRYFEGEEYERRLAATDVMVLPYRKPYQLRVSRVVIEAMLSGMPVIATRGTTLFEHAEEYGVVIGCEEGNVESLAEAMMEAVERFEMLRLNAQERASVAAGFFSAKYFRELLIGLDIKEMVR